MKNRCSPKKKGLRRLLVGSGTKTLHDSGPNHGKFFTTSALKSLWGALFNFWSKNRPQKHQKRAILHTFQANGGLEPPSPPWLPYWIENAFATKVQL